MIKEFFATLPQTIALIFFELYNRLIQLSYVLHIRWGTKTGKILIEIERKTKLVEEQRKKMKEKVREVQESRLNEKIQDESLYKKDEDAKILKFKGKDDESEI